MQVRSVISLLTNNLVKIACLYDLFFSEKTFLVYPHVQNISQFSWAYYIRHKKMVGRPTYFGINGKKRLIAIQW